MIFQKTFLIAGILSLLLSCGQLFSHPVPESPQWLVCQGAEGPGKGKHVVLITADQEYRSEQSLPMLAKILSKRHGFDCTVLFGVNEKGEVDPTMPVHAKKGEEDQFKKHSIPGLEHLASADAVILVTRLLTLPDDQLEKIVSYLDSGKPIIAMRTANHGFRSKLPYERNGKTVQFGLDILGGTFRGHHGGWHREATRGTVVEALKDHPIVTGVNDIWGPSDVYRPYKEGGSLAEGSQVLVLGQPLIGRNPDDEPNLKKKPLPVAWFKNWETSKGKQARVFHTTMGSAKDLENEGLRRMVINSVYWGLLMESAITATSNVDYVGTYQPLASGFNYEKLGVSPKMPAAYR